MSVKIAINGFGRIGRLVFRALAEQGLLGNEVEVVAVGDIVPADNLAYLLKYDSTQGRFKGEVSSKKSSADKEDDDVLVVNGKDIHVVSARQPSGLPWKDLGVELVIESTGLFTGADAASRSYRSGGQKGDHLCSCQRGRYRDPRDGRESRILRARKPSHHFQRFLYD